MVLRVSAMAVSMEQVRTTATLLSETLRVTHTNKIIAEVSASVQKVLSSQKERHAATSVSGIIHVVGGQAGIYPIS